MLTALSNKAERAFCTPVYRNMLRCMATVPGSAVYERTDAAEYLRASLTVANTNASWPAKVEGEGERPPGDSAYEKNPVLPCTYPYPFHPTSHPPRFL
jgi:hypothetical protein